MNGERFGIRDALLSLGVQICSVTVVADKEESYKSTVRNAWEGERIEEWHWDNIMRGLGRRPEPSSFCGTFFNFSWCLGVITKNPPVAFTLGVVWW